MMNKAGFTLMELLIAAAIIGVLAVFATQKFVSTSTDVRVEDTKIRARAIAHAAHRLKWDYPNASFALGESHRFGSVNQPGACYMTEGVTLQTLVNCGYLDYRQYAADYRTSGSGGTVSYSSNFKLWFDEDSGHNLVVCFKRAKGDKSKIDDKKTYCTDGETEFVTTEGE